MAKYNIEIRLDKDFMTALDGMKTKYGETFEFLNGFHENQLDFSEFIDGFVDKNISDVSIDTNANVSRKDIVSLKSEKTKPQDKLFSFNKIFYEIKKKYGLETARQWLETEYNGGFYLHDAPSASQMPYCYAYDLSRLAREGLFFLSDYNNKAPQHLTTFLDDVIEFISFFCARSSGAVGLPNLIVWSYYFWRKDWESGHYIKDKDYYLRQCFQKLIYRLNQPFLRLDQSAFTNVSIFDRCYLEELFGGLEFPDGSFAIDAIENIIAVQKVFMEVISEIRESNMFTYPVLTYSLLYQDGKFVDKPFARWCSDHNTKWNDSNFFISDNVGVLSNCCFDGEQPTLTKSSEGVNYMTFKELYNTPHRDCKRNFTIFHNGNWVKGKVVRLPKRTMYKVTTANNKTLILTDNHISITDKGEKKTTELTTNDYLMFSTKPLNAPKETDRNLSYEQGFLIGMYLGDGSMSGENDKNVNTTINLSLNKEKFENSVDILEKAVKHIGSEAVIKLNKEYNNVYPVKIRDDKTASFIREYVKGNYCFEKELDMNCVLQSIKFRRGILDGFYLTDGGNANRIYSTSEKLINNIECLCTTLGLQTVVNVSDRTGEGKVVIRGNAYNRNHPVYCIRWYNSTKRCQADVYKWCNNSVYFKIKDIEPYTSTDEWCYCFEMLNEDEPYFTLPNGVITHNCRLLSDTKKLDAFINSIGGTALSIGSIKVNTINLVNIFHCTHNKKEYLELLESRVDLCCKVLDRIRHIISRNIEKGLLPNYCDGGIDITKQFCTTGILGLYETVKLFGYTKKDTFGNVYYTDEGIDFAKKIFDVINKVKDSFTDEYSFNVESVPAERAAVILCQKDKALFNIEDDNFIYSNQWIPLTAKCTIQEKLRLSSILDKLCSGGAIAHINIESNFPNTNTAWKMLNHIAQQGVMYFAFNTKINVCKNRHGFVGVSICPTCNNPVYDTYQRIVGFMTPSKAYSKERFKEFNMREWYDTSQMKGE